MNKNISLPGAKWLLPFWVPALLLLIPCLPAGAQFFDFTSGNDAGLVHYDPCAGYGYGGTGTWTFPNKACRIQATNSTAPNVIGPGRAGSTYMAQVFTNFYISAEIVDWDDSLDQFFGVLGRVDNIGLGRTTGYGLGYETRRGRNPSGVFELLRVAGEHGTTLASHDFNCATGHVYRLALGGDGPVLTGQLFDMAQPTIPIFTLSAYDTAFSNGVSGIVIYDETSAGNKTADATFDNLIIDSASPPALQIGQTETGDIVVNWTTSNPHYHLEGCADLGRPTWVDLQSQTYPLDNSYFYFSGIEGQRFYRLVFKP